jgi:probable HAF family extracellular repeat protein
MFLPRSLRGWSLLAALLLGATLAQAQMRYTLTDLGAGIDRQSFTSGAAINNHGQVLIGELARQTAYLHTPGQGLIDLSTVIPGAHRPGYAYHVTAVGLNDAGQVVGSWSARSTERPRDVLGPEAFVFSVSTGMVNLGPSIGGRSDLLAINNAGQILGTLALPRTTFVHHLPSGRTNTALPVDFTGVEINGSGQIAGGISTWDGRSPEFHAALLDRGGVHDLGTLGGHTAEVTGLNNAGWVVGGSDVAGSADDIGIPVRHPFLYRPGVGMTDLGMLASHPLLTYSMALDVNDRGQVVGFQAGHREYGVVPFLYDAASGLVDLNDLLDPITGAGWVIQTATGINNRGQITGTGMVNGVSRAYLLTPAFR